MGRGKLIQAIAILLGLMMVGCGLAYIGDQVYHAWKYNIGGIEELIAHLTMQVLVILLTATLLFTPERSYKRASIYIAAFVVGIILVVAGLERAPSIVYLFQSSWEPSMIMYRVVRGPLELACATILIIKAHRGWKLKSSLAL